MPYGTISSQSVNYEPRAVGTYTKSTLAFGDPADDFRIRPAGSPGKDGKLRASIARVFEKDITIGSATTREPLVVALSVTVPQSGFTATEIDSLATDLATFITSTTVTRLLSGEA